MKIELESLRSKLEQSLRDSENSRVGEELHNLFGQFHARTILRTLLRLIPDLLLTTLLLVSCLYLLEWLLPADGCVFRTFHGGIGSTCLTSSHALLYLMFLGAALLLASFVSTRLKRERRLQHSVLFSVLILFVLLFYAGGGSWSSFEIVAILCLAFFCLFGGYRLGLGSK